MALKMTGAEVKAFLAAESLWPEGVYYEDTWVMVDGVGREEFYDEDGDLPDTARVTVESGDVYRERAPTSGPIGLPERVCTLETYIRRWRRARDTATVAVEVPKGKEAQLRAAVKALGGKLL